MTTSPSPSWIRPFVEHVWNENAEAVKRLQLTYSIGHAIRRGLRVGQNPDDPRAMAYGVHVFCEAPTADAYELVRIIHDLQSKIETAAAASVALILKESSTATNGHPKN